MESNMVDDLIDNTSSLENDTAIKLIKGFFKTKLPNFELVDFVDQGPYYGFRIEYKSKSSRLVFSASSRGFEYEIFVDGKQFSLLNYDERMRNVYSCSEKNLTYTLSVLERFLSEGPRQ